MPIYEYRCGACGSTRELILRSGQEARPSCPQCRKRMKRVISPTAFILKGSGWYVTDYPSQDRKKGLDADKPAAPKKGSAADSTGKSAAAPPPKDGAKKKPRGKKGA